jgi:hypothetical protein
LGGQHARDRHGGDQDRAILDGGYVRHAAQLGPSRGRTLFSDRVPGRHGGTGTSLEDKTPPPGGDAGLHIDPDYKGKGLQIELTVEDEGVFTTPWSATVTYRRGVNWFGSQEWPETVCDENRHEYYGAKDTAVPRAEKPDF